LVFAALLIYVLFFQDIFNTTALGWKDWGMLFVFMVGIFILEELRKRAWGNRTISGGRPKEETYLSFKPETCVITVIHA
jgi:hypothetical protein